MYWIAVGDVHESAGMLGRIPGVEGAQGLILTGDLTNRGGAEKALRVLAAARQANPRVLAQQGNMDLPEVTDLLAREGVNIHREALLLAPGLALMGVGWSTPTPFGTPSETPDTTLAFWLEETRKKALELAPSMLAIIHNPPVNTRLDRTASGRHVGSRAVRDFLECARPLACICGHIHEAVGEDTVGGCPVFNPGLLSEGGYVRITLADGDLRLARERV